MLSLCQPVGSDHLELDEAAMAEALRQVSLQPELSGGGGGAGDTCDCNHCAQAKFVQQQSQVRGVYGSLFVVCFTFAWQILART